MLFLSGMRERLTIVSLDGEEYFQPTARSASHSTEDALLQTRDQVRVGRRGREILVERPLGVLFFRSSPKEHWAPST